MTTTMRTFMNKSARTTPARTAILIASPPKGEEREAKLSYMGYATMENWHGLALALCSHVKDTAERCASEIMLKAKS